MSKIIFIDGGIGRVLCSIPALLKYHKLNPNKEWYIVVPAWDYLFWGIPELQDISFNCETKGIEKLWLNADEVISPEPYRVPKYYRNEISLAESFDFEINKTTNHSDLPDLTLSCSSSEIDIAYNTIKSAKEQQGKNKTIVIQPYGSTANKKDYGIVDFSNRSIPEEFYELLIENLMKDYNVIYMGFESLHDGKTFMPNQTITGMREWATIIQYCDYFIGCDSCGQHMAKAVGTDASVFIAGTHEVNVSYPNDFHIIKKDLPFYRDSMRISGFASNLSSRLNEERTEFSEEEMIYHYNDIIKRIES
jgi:hypothetical protein